MDFSYFLDDSGKFKAKRLPAPKGQCVKFKDVTDLYLLREDIKDYKPSSVEEFEKVYENCFDSPAFYDIEVDYFEQAILANKNSFLGEHTWIKRYWHEVGTFFIDGRYEDEEEYEKLFEEPLSKILVKEGFADKKEALEYEDWSKHFSCMNLTELKPLAKQVGIKVSQTKSDLIHALITYQEDNGNFVEPPSSLTLNKSFFELITNLNKKFVDEFETVLSTGDYPRVFQAVIWETIRDVHDGLLIEELAEEKLAAFSDIFESENNSISKAPEDIEIPVSMGTNSVAENLDVTLSPSIKIQFDYKDYNSNPSSREIRLDRIEQDGIDFYLHGFCYLRNDVRCFKLDRISDDVVMTDTGEVIEKEELLPLGGIGKSEYLKSDFGQFKNSVKKVSGSNFGKSTEGFKASEELTDRKVGLLLGLGIFIMPYIFAWFTLRKGHSKLSQAISFGWLAFMILAQFKD